MTQVQVAQRNCRYSQVAAATWIRGPVAMAKVAFCRRAWLVPWVAALSLAGSSLPAVARSTASAVFSAPAVAGPGIEQTVDLLVRYYPGDGEAVVRGRLRVLAGQVRVLDARSRRGVVASDSAGWMLDYAAAPLAAAAIDTVSLRLVAGEAASTWELAVGSTGADGAATGPAARAELQVAPPLGVELVAVTDTLYAGGRADLSLAVRNRDARGRTVDRLWLQLPSCMKTPGEAAVVAGPLPAGAADTLVVAVQVATDAPAAVSVNALAAGSGLADSPVAAAPLAVLQAADFRLITRPDPLEVGRQGVVSCVWRTPAGRGTLAVGAVGVSLPAALADPALLGASAGQARIGTSAAGWTPLAIDSLDADLDSVVATFRVRATDPGPWVVRPWATPCGHVAPVPLAANSARVRVVLPGTSARGEKAPAGQVPTDLDLFASGLRAALGPVVEQLPLAAAGQVAIRPEARTERHWLVEESLAQLLLSKGRSVRVAAGPGPAGTLRYRVAEARVICGAPTRGWRFWSPSQPRDVAGDLFLRLESPSGTALWAGRVRLTGGDRVVTSAAAGLASTEAVPRAAVATDSRWIERSLSVCIAGGLFYIFFLL